jgi:small subunit ribosomal protein S18
VSNRTRDEINDDDYDEEDFDDEYDEDDDDDTRVVRRRASRASRPSPRPRRRRRGRSEYCPDDGPCFNYKDVNTLQQYISEIGRIKPRRQTNNCARCQRELAREIKRARHLSLLPFVDRE